MAVKKKILIAIGTRPEAIKTASLIKAYRAQSGCSAFQTEVCVTAQHREMLDQMLEFFEIFPDYDLDLMSEDQDLYHLTGTIMLEMKAVLRDFDPDYVFVQGDTTTSAMVGLAAFYHGAKVCHIEAGLRTNNKRSPFPEELNRQLTSRIADIHFTPTEAAKENLVKENIPPETIHVVGNTGVDSLLWTIKKEEAKIPNTQYRIPNTDSPKTILVTGHRRENFGKGLQNICKALIELAQRSDVQIVYPLHLNPSVQKAVLSLLSGYDNINLCDPLSYPEFVRAMANSYLILTDSGGIQEEAPYLGKPVLIMREATERNELVEAGTAFMVGTDTKEIISKATALLDNKELHKKMSKKSQPYGDGKAAERIIEIIKLKQ